MKFDNESTKIAEQSVIGAILIDEKSLARVIDIIKAEDFYFSQLKDFYKTILDLSSKGKPIDFVTVLSKVVSEGVYSESEVKRLLFECTQLIPSVSNVEHYAKIIANSHKARRLKRLGAKLSLDEVSAETADDIANEVMS